MILLYEIVDCDIEILDNKAVCVLYVMNSLRASKRIQMSVSNLTKFLKCMDCQRLEQTIAKTIRCKVNDHLKITHISRMHLDTDEWIVGREVANEV